MYRPLKLTLISAFGFVLLFGPAVAESGPTCQMALEVDLEKIETLPASLIRLGLLPLTATFATAPKVSEFQLSEFLDNPVVEVPTEGVWRLGLQAEELWFPDRKVSCGADQVDVPVFSVGWLRGSFESTAANSLPSDLTAHVAIFEEGDESQKPETGEVRCSVDGAQWRCRVPAVEWYIRLQPAGYQSLFIGDRQLEPGQDLEIGPLSLKRGGNVLGEIRTTDGTPLDGSTVVRAIKASAATGDGLAPPEPQDIWRSDRPTEDGFFHLRGLPPGVFVVEVAQHGFTSARSGPLQVAVGESAALPTPLVLERPMQLQVEIEPALDSHGKPWQVLLVVHGQADIQQRQEADSTGSVVFAPLAPATYALVVRDSQGSGLAQEKVQLTQSQTLQVAIDQVVVEGVVTLGGEPLPATLFFGGERNAVKVKTYADEEGRFRATLPHAGSWPLDVRALEPSVFRRLPSVEVEDGEEVTQLEIALPATTLRGRTVDPEGAPFAHAAVLLASEVSGEPLSHLNSDAEGIFEFAGLPASRFKIQAFREIDGLRWSSEQVLVELEDGDDLPLVVELVPPRRLVGSVTAPGVGPVAGVQVSILPVRDDGRPGMLFLNAVTSETGEFEVAVPEADLLELTVQEPGYALYRQRTRVDFTKSVQIELSQGVGTLILELDQEPTPMTQPVVRIGDVGYVLSILKRWAAKNGVTNEGMTVEIPAMPPGLYQGCWLDEGAADFARTCVEGYLLGGGSLTLRSPSLPPE